MRFIELNHIIHDGLITYQGLDAPHICDFWTREASAANYEDGATFHIGKIDMVANTGTYVDVPFHRFEEGDDLAAVGLHHLAALDGLLIDCTNLETREIPVSLLPKSGLKGKAVLFYTGWDQHWDTDQYFGQHPYLATETAELLKANKVALVGIDSYNIDDAHTKKRPVHTTLLGAGIPIVEHLCHLENIPSGQPFRFTAVPPRIKGLGSFPVRAFASLDNDE